MISPALIMMAINGITAAQELYTEHKMDKADLEALAEEMSTMDHQQKGDLLLERSQALQARADALRAR